MGTTYRITVVGPPDDVNKKAGFKRYGLVKSQFIILKGSIAGPSKRMIILTKAIRPNKLIPKEAPPINYISK